MRARFVAALACALTLGIAAPGAGQGTHLLVITGLSGDPSFAKTFASSARALVDATRGWRVPPNQVTWLAEDSTRDPVRMTGRSSKEGIAAAFDRLTTTSRTGDTVIVVLIGHGSGEGAGSRISMPGPDPAAADYARWLDALAGRVIVAVVAASGSGDFLPVLARPGRVVITATRSATERNESHFGVHWVQGLTSGEADADKDGRVSILESFTFATRAVARAYEDDHRLLTEHAVLDDNGDGKGSSAAVSDGSADGLLARRITLGGRTPPTDPRAATLLAERDSLEAAVAALRLKKTAMPDAQYAEALEKLLVQIAERTAAIRALGGAGQP